MGVLNLTSTAIQARPATREIGRSSKAIADWLNAVLPCTVARGAISRADTDLVLAELEQVGAQDSVVAAALVQTGYTFAFSGARAFSFTGRVGMLYAGLKNYIPARNDLGPQQTTMGPAVRVDAERFRYRLAQMEGDARLAMAMGNWNLARHLVGIILIFWNAEAAEAKAQMEEEKEKIEEIQREVEMGAEGEGEEVKD